MKTGGSVKKVKKMAVGGQALNKAKGYAPAQKGGDNVKMGIYGMSNAGTTGPNRTAGYDYKKGGATKKLAKAQSGAEVSDKSKKPLSSLGSKIGVGSVIIGGVSTAVKAASDKIKANKAKKEEQKKKEAATTKGKFGMSVAVKPGCRGGMVKDASGKCVNERPKFKSGGSSFGMLSVKKGIDNNPEPTQADRIAGATMKKGGSTDKKWIQKAINPAHKGYCTPMTKPTCTPKRKALAMTLKKISKNR